MGALLGGAILGLTGVRAGAAQEISDYQAAGCGSCHGAALEGGVSPPLSGEQFRAKWSAPGGEALLQYIRTQMPPAAPRSLPDETYRRITSFILAQNGLPPMAAAPQQRPTPPAAAAQPAPGRGAQNAAAVARWTDQAARDGIAQRRQKLDRLTPVTTAVLAKPKDQDWLHFRRNYESQGYSPLKAINRANAGQLGLAWSLSLEPGTNQITPLVHDGVMFLHSNSAVYALDAATGDVLWISRLPERRPGGLVTNPRGMAIYGSSVIVGTPDNHILSLDARSGAVNWNKEIQGVGGRSLSAAPMVVRGKVIQGVSGCAGGVNPGGCFIVALDATTGAEAWRLNTIERPGGATDSWGGVPLEQRYGGSVWATGSYDPQLNLVYFGVAQTYRIGPMMAPVRGPNTTTDGLYTNSTLAIDPDTGKLVWHYQHVQREIWDLDWSFERQLTDLRVGGVNRRVVMTMGKIGILDVLDARTGKYISSADMGLQTLVSSIDPETGAKHIDARFYPPAGQEIEHCPWAGGGRNFPATAYDPGLGMLYVPATEACQTFSWTAATGANRWTPIPLPGTDGKLGRVQAIDIASGKTVWTQRRRAPPSSAVLSTAGGLIFEGDRDRWFRASDSRTGRVLWQTRLSAAPNAFPVSYEAGGEQFVSVTSGGGGAIDVGMRTMTPEINATAAQGNTLWVFKRQTNRPAR